MVADNNNNQAETRFDFDHWMKLAEENPEVFEQKRQDKIQAFIKEVPKQRQQRLIGLQWRIDTEIKLANNPVDACLKIHQMMMDSVFETDGLLNTLTLKKCAHKPGTIKNIFDIKK